MKHGYVVMRRAGFSSRPAFGGAVFTSRAHAEAAWYDSAPGRNDHVDEYRRVSVPADAREVHGLYCDAYWQTITEAGRA